VPLDEILPDEMRILDEKHVIKDGYPLRNRYFTAIDSSTTVADRYRLAAYNNKHC